MTDIQKKTQFQIAVENEIKCDLCGSSIFFMYGNQWDNDRAICSNRECSAEIVYPTTTTPEELE